MEFNNNFRTFLIAIIPFFAVLIYGCANTGNLVLKTTNATTELNQTRTIGIGMGNIPPDFTVVTTEEKTVTLSEFARNKKPVVVYFMATWCPYCVRDYTSLSKVYKNYENNLSFLSISLDLSEDPNVLGEYKKKYLELQNTMFAPGQSDILINYAVKKTTTKYAIDRNGRIIYAGFGAFDDEQWKQLLDALTKGVDNEIESGKNQEVLIISENDPQDFCTI